MLLIGAYFGLLSGFAPSYTWLLVLRFFVGCMMTSSCLTWVALRQIPLRYTTLGCLLTSACPSWVVLGYITLLTVFLGSIHTYDLLGVNYCMNFWVQAITKKWVHNPLISSSVHVKSWPNSKCECMNYLVNRSSSCNCSYLINLKCEWTLNEKIKRNYVFDYLCLIIG